MGTLKKLLNAVKNRFKTWVLLPVEKNYLKKIKSHSDELNGGGKYTVLIDGIVSMELVSIYYLFLLLVLSRLSKRAVKVVVITIENKYKNLKCNRLFKYVFETEYVSLPDYLNRGEREGAAKLYAGLINGVKSAKDVFELQVQGVNFGPNIYSSYVRDTFLGTISEINHKVKEEIKTGVDNIISAKKIIAAYSPDLIIFSHTEYHSYGSVFKCGLSKGIPVVQTVPYTVGRIGGRIYKTLSEYEDDPKNYMFSITNTLFDKIKAQYTDGQDNIIKKYLAQRYSGNDPNFNGDYHSKTKKLEAAKLKERIGVASDKKAALVAAHLLWDDSTSSYRNLYYDYEIWLQNVVKAARRNTNMYWVIKGHPSEVHMGTKRSVKDIVSEVCGGRLPENIKYVDGSTDLNTYSLIDMADTVLTVRGTIGLEAVCKGKNVITCGSGPYSGLGFTKDFDNIPDYEKFLDNLHLYEDKLTEAQIRDARIACYVYFLLKAPDCKAISHGDMLKYYTELKYEDILNDESLVRFAKQIVELRSGDMI